MEAASAPEHSELPLEQEAARRLEAYRDGGSCAPVCAGYLDLFGNVWGCLVQGDGWAEVLVVAGAEDGSSTARTVRIGAQP